MRSKKSHSNVEELVDEAVRRYANSDPPAGLEARVLQTLKRRKMRTHRRLHVASLAVAGLLSVLMFDPDVVDLPHLTQDTAMISSGIPHQYPKIQSDIFTDAPPVSLIHAPEAIFLDKLPVAISHYSAADHVISISFPESNTTGFVVQDLEISSLQIAALAISKLEISE
jgi:hypothetical protein